MTQTNPPTPSIQSSGEQQAAPSFPAAGTASPALWARLVLLALILLGFLRLVWALEGKDLWWDESLSLQRAESTWLDILLGRLVLTDGLSELVTYDQHPFFFFLVQGVLLRLAGDSEFVLRWPSVMASTLLIPMVWTWGRGMVRQGVLPASAPLWAALLAAAHPFYLWYGQEARPYALWAFLALCSTYCLWRLVSPAPTAPDSTAPDSTVPDSTVEGGGTGPVLRGGAGWGWAYAVTAAMFYTTHYYAVFLLPVQALLIAVRLWQHSRRLALGAAMGALAAGMAVGLFAYWSIVLRQGGGGNFPDVALSILLPDLLNAFTLGPSVDIDRVWWLDVLGGLVALAGAIFCLRSRRVLRAGGWLGPALVVAPILVLLAANLIYPAYMNARHMSLIGGGYILLLAGGLAWLTRQGRVAGLGAGLIALALLAGMGLSTRNYFTLEEYAKDDFSGIADYMDRRMAPGDLLLIQSPFAWRIFAYYLPLDAVEAAQAQGAHMAAYGVPLIRRSWPAREAQLQEWAEEYRRVWLVLSNTHPYMDVERRTEAWMVEHLYRVRELIFFSHSSLSASLYLDDVPVYNGPPPPVESPMDVVFGDRIRLAGLETGEPVHDALGLPVTLHWQSTREMEHRYKYILQLEEVEPDGAVRTIALTEREPYEGAIPTIYWAQGQTIVEYSELPPATWPNLQDNPARYRLSLQVYRADTLEKLPITEVSEQDEGTAGRLQVSDDGFALFWSDWPGAADRR